MTGGADDALFGQDGTGPSADGPGGNRSAEAPAKAHADGNVVRPVTAAPGWITGEPAPPWPPPDAVPPPARPATPAPRSALPVRRAAPSRPATRPFPVPDPPPRPRVVEEPGILGLSRRARGRLGSRLFTWFFILVFALIAAQMVASIVSIVDPW